jgi:hypothetical protein
MTTLKRTTVQRAVAPIVAACIVILLLPPLAVDATAQEATAVEGFVTGSGNTDGFTILGRLRQFTDGSLKGRFTIVVHRDFIDGNNVAVYCDYTRFDSFTIDANLVSFHSVGKCKALTASGGQQSFTSDNAFAIADHGEPGAANDAVDVNLLTGSGVTIPGSLLVDGNFLVSP